MIRIAQVASSSRAFARIDGAAPLVLVVFDDPLAPVHFLRVAQVEMARTGVNVPLWVSDRETLEQAGPVGQAWRNPDIWYPTYAFA